MTEIIVLTIEEIERLKEGKAVVFESREGKQYHIMSEETFGRLMDI
jgi:hypothetical protein